MPNAYSREEVSSALNRAADEVLDAAGAPDTGLRDAVNLVVNASLSYLTGEAATLAGVVEVNYDTETLDEVLDWIHG